MNLDHIAQRLRDAQRVAVLTGAGVSAESGVATFRDPGGLWSKFSPYELASMDGFLANPQRVWEWYQHRRQIVEHVQPNPGHVALAELERIIPQFTLITQNVDRLHQRAGSRHVLELHGNLEENRCVECGVLHHGAIDTSVAEPPTCVHCGGRLRPNVVWFGEDLPQDVFRAAEDAATQCDVFMSIGTSAEVYPAAELPYRAKQFGAFVIEVNPTRTALTPHVHVHLEGQSGDVLPRLLALMTVNA